MTDNFIKLNQDNLLILEIETSEGIKTGERLVFDLDDIELPLRLQELVEKDKKNKENLRNQLLIIQKRQDVKGKKLMSKNQEDEIKALNEFFKKEVEVYNMFLGENGVEKILNGRKLGWTSLDEIDEIIDTQIRPKLDINLQTTLDKVKEKYAKAKARSEEIEVIE